MRSLNFQVHLVEHCNLNCKGCDHFSPIAEKEFLEANQYERDLVRLKELFGDENPLITLLGGEALLHPELTAFFSLSRKYFPSADIVLITNGVLLDKMKEEFWISCKNNKIRISPTKYPVRANYQKAEELAAQYGIKYNYFDDYGTVKTLWKHPLDINGTMNPEEMFYCCGESNYCITLRSGRLYTCSVAAYIKHFTKFFDIELEYAGDNNGIDIYKASDKYEIMEFLRKPIDMCRHCKVKERTFDNPWSTSKKELSEWT